MARVCRNLGGEMYRNEWCRDKETGNLALFRYSFSSTYDISRCITIGTKRRVPVVSVHVDAPLEGVDPKTDRAWQKFAASQGFVTKTTTEEMEKDERRQVAQLLRQREAEEKRRQELARQRQEEARQHAKWQRETGYLLSPLSKGISVCSKKAIDVRSYKAFIEDSNGLRLQLRLTEELVNGRYVILQNQRIIWDNVNNWKECRRKIVSTTGCDLPSCFWDRSEFSLGAPEVNSARTFIKTISRLPARTTRNLSATSMSSLLANLKTFA